MIASAPEHKERVYGPLDYALTGVYSCLAAYSVCAAVGAAEVAYLFCSIIAAGTIFSAYVQRFFADEPIVRYDSICYVAVGFAVLFFRNDLGKMVPDQVFVERLMVAGTLAWLLSLGSFFTWRDGTLLFQAVPSIALFGMVGTFDTFQLAPTFFFGFLLCLALLFARSHRRMMIDLAEASGYKASLDAEEQAASNRGSNPRKKARLQAFYEGPWRWMAGPEWALASALAVVLLSSQGAPFLQDFLKPISGVVRIVKPPLTQRRAPDVLGGNDSRPVRIGTGPQSLSQRIVLRAKLDKPRYLKIRSYDSYEERAWTQGTVNTLAAAGTGKDTTTTPLARSLAEIKDPENLDFSVDVIDASIGGFPVPGEVPNNPRFVSDSRNIRQQRDGTFRLSMDEGHVPEISGTALIPPAGREPRDAAKNLPLMLEATTDASMVPQEVADLARQVTAGAKTDYEKALAIKAEIERRCRYNLLARATPGGVDPVVNFLFTSNEGYCDLFASAMVLMARAVGIPSRYTTGFYPIKLEKDDSNYWVMRESEAHAWADLFFADVGWVQFDTTEGAISVGDGRGGATEAGPWYQRAWVRQTLDVAIVLVLLTASIYAFVRHRRSKAGSGTRREDVGKEYARFVSLVQRASGRRRQPSDTPDEFLRGASAALGVQIARAESLNGQFVSALYSPAQATPATLDELRKDTNALRSELRDQHARDKIKRK